MLQVPGPGAPPSPPPALSPVLVFIHGGAFYTGTANSHIYGPDYLLREDLVLVTIQYRLGALGECSAAVQNVQMLREPRRRLVEWRSRFLVRSQP